MIFKLPFLKTTYNLYHQSSLGQKILRAKDLGKDINIAFLDLDSTMTGDAETVNTTRKLLEDQNYIVVFVTSRTAELVMSEESYLRTKLQKATNRPAPLMDTKNNLSTYIATDKITPSGLLDPDIIASSTGTEIYVKQKNNAYHLHKTYWRNFGTNSKKWRQQVGDAISYLDSDSIAIISAIDQIGAYKKGRANIAPPDYRFQLEFKTLTAFATFIKNFEDAKSNKKTPRSIRRILTNLQIIDDSKPDVDVYKCYVTPKNGDKTKATDTIVSDIIKYFGLLRSNLNVLFAGDSFPDLHMGLMAAKQTKADFLVVGGSRLTNTIVNKHSLFVSQDTTFLKMLLKETASTGIYTVVSENQRNCIVGELTYPRTTGVETVQAYLNRPTD